MLLFFRLVDVVRALELRQEIVVAGLVCYSNLTLNELRELKSVRQHLVRILRIFQAGAQRLERQVIGILRRGYLALRHNFLVNILNAAFMAVLLLQFLLSLNIGLAALSPLWIEVGGLHPCDAWVELILVRRGFVVLRQSFPVDPLQD